ncbi:MAG: porin family protein, partial [Gammaproteobacteria bacterium]|nr:porin family protein [Gammaproteobacteria bacterium]
EVSASEDIPLVGSADVDLDGSSWDISVRPTLPLSDKFHAFGIAGWAQYDLEYTASIDVTGLPPIEISDSEKEGEFFFGLGAGFDMTDNWTLRGEWITVNVDDGAFGMFSVAATYNFR